MSAPPIAGQPDEGARIYTYKALPALPLTQEEGPTPPLPLVRRRLLHQNDGEPRARILDAQISALQRKNKSLQQMIATNKKSFAEKDRIIVSLQEQLAQQSRTIEKQNSLVTGIARTINNSFQEYHDRLLEGHAVSWQRDSISDIIQAYSQIADHR